MGIASRTNRLIHVRSAVRTADMKVDLRKLRLFDRKIAPTATVVAAASCDTELEIST
jgi:hypothetical protein